MSDYRFEDIAPGLIDLHAQRGDFVADPNAKQPFYALGMFPYPSGNAHMGHVRVYTITDVIARFARLRGAEAANPIGWDAFGLPAENAAIQNKVRPDVWTKQNIDRMKNVQFARMGWSFDWSRELNTSSPDYYRWTQWIFLKLLERGVAYKAKALVNWCTTCATVLANEQVNDGLCWRCASVVEKRRLEQWFLRTSDYADRLWKDLDKLKNWNREAVAVQRNWIGRSEGAVIEFAREGQSDCRIPVFTTRADTLFGVSAIVLAPEHPLVDTIIQETGNEAVRDYVASALRKSSRDRLASKEKSGVPTGVYATQALLGEKKVEIWVGDYVIADYGTGAVMCVPAHDVRDYEFAKRFGLDILEVIKSAKGDSDVSTEAFTDDGVLVASGEFSGARSAEARQAIVTKLEETSSGARKVHFNLRDWSVSRQRYWGCPIPVVNCEQCGPVGVSESDLPVLLAEDVRFEDGKASIASDSSFHDTPCPRCGTAARRETDTLDTFMCSAWYAFRFCDAQNDGAVFDSERVNRWMPINAYVGGLEHAAQHMIYFRFLTKFLHDIGYVNFDEPVDHFFCNGMVRKDGAKMSKSRGNVVVPTEVIDKFGADALRFYILSDTPAELDVDWDDTNLFAKEKFLRKNYAAIAAFLQASPPSGADPEPTERGSSKPGRAGEGLDWDALDALDFLRRYYSTQAQLERDLERNEFHNCIARIHELSAILLRKLADGSAAKGEGATRVLQRVVRDFLVVNSLFAPFFSEDLWRKHYSHESLYRQRWPQVEARFLEVDRFPCVVQINGKKRGIVEADVGISEQDIKALVLADPTVQKHLAGKQIRRTIYLPGRLVNIVV